MNILWFPSTKKCKIYTKQFPLNKEIEIVPEPTVQSAVPGVSPGRGVLILY